MKTSWAKKKATQAMTPIEKAIKNQQDNIRRLMAEDKAENERHLAQEKAEKERHTKAMREISRKIGAKQQVLDQLKR